jgi:hypothetical protein
MKRCKTSFKIDDFYKYNTKVGLLTLFTHIVLCIVILLCTSVSYLVATFNPILIFYQYYPLGITIGFYLIYCSYPLKVWCGSLITVFSLMSAVGMILNLIQYDLNTPAEEKYTGTYWYPLWGVTNRLNITVYDYLDTNTFLFYTWGMVMTFLVFVVSLLHFGFSFYMCRVDGVADDSRFNHTAKTSTDQTFLYKDALIGIPWIPIVIKFWRTSDNRIFCKLRFAISCLSICTTLIFVYFSVITYFYLARGVITYSPFSNPSFILIPLVVHSIMPPPMSPPNGDDPVQMEAFNTSVYAELHMNAVNAVEGKHKNFKFAEKKIRNENVFWSFGQVNSCIVLFMGLFFSAIIANLVILGQNADWRNNNGIGQICTNPTAERLYALETSPKTFNFYGNPYSTPVKGATQTAIFRSAISDLIGEFSCASEWLNVIVVFLSLGIFLGLCALYTGEGSKNDADVRLILEVANKGRVEFESLMKNSTQVNGKKKPIATRLMLYLPSQISEQMG